QEDFLPHSIEPSSSHSTQTMTVLAFSKELLDFFPTALGELVTDSSFPHPDPFVRDSFPLILCGDVGLHFTFEKPGQKCVHKICLICTQGLRRVADTGFH